MKFRYALLANYAEKNEAGAINVVSGGYDGYFLDRVPTIVGSLAVVAAFDIEPGDLGNEFSFNVEILDPEGSPIFLATTVEKAIAEVHFPGQLLTHFVVFYLTHWTVRASGLYRFWISLEGERVADVPFGLVDVKDRREKTV